MTKDGLFSLGLAQGTNPATDSVIPASEPGSNGLSISCEDRELLGCRQAIGCRVKPGMTVFVVVCVNSPAELAEIRHQMAGCADLGEEP